MRRKFAKFYQHFSPSDLFAVVDDIESYPSFIPFCQHARVLSSEGASRRVENVFGLGRLHLSFLSSARSDLPRQLIIESRDGALRAFQMRWLFEPRGEGCQLSCDLVLEFSSQVLNALAPLAVADFERKIMGAFERRAAARTVCEKVDAGFSRKRRENEGF